MAKAYSDQFRVSIYGQSLHNLRRAEIAQVSDEIIEYQGIDVGSFISSLACRSLRIPQLLQSTALTTSAPAWLRSQVTEADVVVMEQPWQAGWLTRAISRRCVLVYDAHNVELDTFIDVGGPEPIKRKLLSFIRDQEMKAVTLSDIVVVTSAADKDRMTSLYGCNEEKIHIAPNGVNIWERPATTESARKLAKQNLGLTNRKSAIFLGAKHPPNKGAVELILQIAGTPECSETEFFIVGAVSAYFPNCSAPNVRFTGFVPDTKPFLAAADVAINTVESGGGSSLKQVEYMACGLPTVVTPFGARGFNITDGENAIVREPQRIVDGLLLLLRNPPLAAEIGRKARATATEYDWKSIGARLADRFASLSIAKHNREAQSD